MPILGKLKNIFSVGTSSSNDGRKKSKFPYIKQDLDPNELWEIVGELGDGAFGKVYKAQQKQKREFAALKQVDINDESELEDYSIEIDILIQCKHKNIVGLYESFLFGGKLWMFIEFCELGALDSIMLELEKPLTEPQIQYICREMCEGLDFLHQNFIIHRDLKAGNVLLTQDGGVRLADFGVSAKNSSLKQKRDSYIGTPYWMAPEVILCETIKDSPYDFRADIWSFGITLIEFSQIEPPNHEMHPMRVVLKIQKSDPPTLRAPHKWSKSFNDFISKCLFKDPEKRWTTAELLQHHFIKDVRNNSGIADLISELGAEITLEEKDIEEYLGEDADTTPESDSSSLSKVINNDDTLRPQITVNKCDENDVIGDCKTKKPIGEQGLDISSKPNVSLTSTSDDKIIPSITASGPEDEMSDSTEFDRVILRDKRNKNHPEENIEDTKLSEGAINNKTQSPGTKADLSEMNKKKYRSLTKTRKFVVNGEVVTSKVQKFIGNDGEEKQKEHKLWKADLRELKMLHRMENRQLQDLEFKSQQAIEEQMKRFEQDELALKNMYEANLDMLSRQHKQQIDRMFSTHANEKKSLLKKIKSEQEREMKSFMEGLKQDMKWMKQEVELLPKELRKEALLARKTLKESDHQEKLHKFVDEQKKQMEKLMAKLDDQQAEQYSLSEKQFLQQKQQIIRAKEEAMWDMEERHMMERYQLAEQLLKSKFILKRSLMMQRHSKETDQVKRINSCKEDEVLACHALEWKRLPKILKSDAKTRALMYRESIRISVINITLDEERNKIKKFEEMEKKRAKEERARLEAKHKRQLDDIRAKNNYLIKELEQVHTDKQNMLLENEMQKTAELSNSYRSELKIWKEEISPKKKKLEELFTAQLSEQEKFLLVRDYQGALAVTTSASVTPILRTKFPQIFLFGKITDQTEDSSGVSKANPLRSSKRSSTFGGLGDKLRESFRSSFPSMNFTDEVNSNSDNISDKQSRRHSALDAENAEVQPQEKEMEKLSEKTEGDKFLVGGDAVEKERLDRRDDEGDLEVNSGASFNSSNTEAHVRIPIICKTLDDSRIIDEHHETFASREQSEACIKQIGVHEEGNLTPVNEAFDVGPMEEQINDDDVDDKEIIPAEKLNDDQVIEKIFQDVSQNEIVDKPETSPWDREVENSQIESSSVVMQDGVNAETPTSLNEYLKQDSEVDEDDEFGLTYDESDIISEETTDEIISEETEAFEQKSMDILTASINDIPEENLLLLKNVKPVLDESEKILQDTLSSGEARGDNALIHPVSVIGNFQPCEEKFSGDSHDIAFSELSKEVDITGKDVREMSTSLINYECNINDANPSLFESQSIPAFESSDIISGIVNDFLFETISFVEDLSSENAKNSYNAIGNLSSGSPPMSPFEPSTAIDEINTENNFECERKDEMMSRCYIPLVEKTEIESELVECSGILLKSEDCLSEYSTTPCDKTSGKINSESLDETEANLQTLLKEVSSPETFVQSKESEA